MNACRGWRRYGAILCATLLAVCASGCREQASAPSTALPLLRIGVLPDLDSLPIAIALQKGWFFEAGIRVKLVRAASAVERDQLLQTD